MKVRNTFIIFLVSGFWHGANWTFIVWGLLNAIFIMPSIIFHTNRNNLEIVAKGSFLPSLKELISIVITFLLAVLAWIFFRAESLTHAFEYLSRILTLPGLPQGYAFLYGGLGVSKMAALILGLLVIEWIGREYEHPLARVSEMKHLPVRWAVYFFMVGCIHYFYGESQQFIYFEF